MGPQAAQAAKIASEMTLSEKADAIEEHMMHELDKIVTKSVFSNMTDGHVDMEGGAALMKKYPGKYFNMGPDPRLPPMPEKPTLLDYFKNRFASTNHLLQSGALAIKNGHSEKVVLACLLHDIVEEYKRARSNKYYMTARLICVNDVYAFDPNAKVELDAFEDVIGRNFR